MKKKFAVCFSGYPRFVKKTFNNIKENFLDGLGSYDIYANFQWNEDWKNTQIHHEFVDTYETNELEDFEQFYKDLNLKKLKVNNPFVFDVSYYDKMSLEPDMILSLEKSRDILYRMKSQYQGILDCVNLIDNPDDYEYFIRVRTDLIFHSEINMENLQSDNVLSQNGFVAGWDRKFCDWFFIVPRKHLKFYEDLAKIEYHFKDGIRHMHKLVEEVGNPYQIEHHEFYVGIPSTSQHFGQLLKDRK
jgi:hypothetical protein